MVKSIGLKEILNTVLSIGNAMNLGTHKGSQTSFKIHSLIKLQQTKSTIDASMTVLDYLIQVSYCTSSLSNSRQLC